MTTTSPIREIPYNYTSFSDREIVLRLLNERAWEILEKLRNARNTGVSAHMLLEMLGDMWIASRNPYIQDDLLSGHKQIDSLNQSLQERICRIEERAEGNPHTLELISLTKQAVKEFSDWFPKHKKLRKKAKKKFKDLTDKNNILFDGLSRVSHVTDATDWRVELPFVVLTPDTEDEIAALVQCCIELDLTVIPRGGGTGYTGGAIPLSCRSAVINTEKLEFIGSVQERDDISANSKTVSTVKTGAGVVTKRVSELAQKHNLVFAVDPTSQDASTIGGNVSMNAGGKKAVLWGTTLDNLVSWRMVTPDAEWLEVKRINHNLGKIHEAEAVEFQVTRFAQDGKTQQGEIETLNYKGSYFRKEGLGKDVTNKFLGGLPGIQKEGCDGLITSAEFILHKMPDQIRTVCLEFYGTDLHEAVPAIVEIKDALDNNPDVLLSGLEHLDERYVKAVKYTPKGARGSLPKMVLIADIVGDDDNKVAAAASNVIQLANQRNAEGFVAISPEARRLFWLDRARTAAIAAHTNAFKINEDVVIPLHNLAAYSEGIERINIRQSMLNKVRTIDAMLACLQGSHPELKQVANYEDSQENDDILQSKINNAVEHLQTTKDRWNTILENFDSPALECSKLLNDTEQKLIRTDDKLINLLLRRDLIISYRNDVKERLQQIFVGNRLKPLRDNIVKIHKKHRSSRLFIALHMHAGDGNVHTNIPVNSHNYDMMHEAEGIVDEIMALTQKLDGVISGEHGIGLTKMQYLEPEVTKSFARYKNKVDPNGHFNRGKLMPDSGLQNAYTPSLRLVERETILLENDELGELNNDIKDCLRCGKCKPVCTTHIPRANLLYSPRNKILATGLSIEAFLYEEQAHRGISLRHFDELNDVADHCTICHKCLSPCPVNIDFGNVSVRMRKLLKDRKQRKTNIVTKTSMMFLNTKKPTTIKAAHVAMIDIGFRAQSFGHSLFKLTGFLKNKTQPAKTIGKAALTEQVVEFIKRPLPADVPLRTTRAMLGLEDNKIIPIIRDAKKTTKDSDAVFYFPGCGSERLFSQVGLATLAMLHEIGTTTVLPPGYLCCGYPQNAGGDTEQASKISTDNRVLFHRVAQALGYLNIKTIIVSCGTCMDQLLKYEFERIFPDCRLLDIHEYLMEKDVKIEGIEGQQYLYHEPCHTPMKQHNSITVASTLLDNKNVKLSDRCCGEAGTFAVSRPDIASQLRFRKEDEIKQGIMELTGENKAKNGNVKMLTSCPACQQGLSRYRDETGLDTDYIVVEIANNLLGDKWQKTFIDKAINGGIEKVLL